MKKSRELIVMHFDNQYEWTEWLKTNHSLSAGIKMKIARKGAGVISVSYSDALEAALCFGWIDSRKEALDDKFWIQRFTPRGPRSMWSKINREKAEQLIKTGKMQSVGQKAIDAAKKNGQWDKAYQSQSNKQLPDDFEEALMKNPKAKSFFETLNNVNRYAIIFRIGKVKKPETRLRKIAQFLEMLEKGEKIYP